MRSERWGFAGEGAGRAYSELTPSACDTEATLSVSTTVAGAHR